MDQGGWRREHPEQCECDGGGMCPNPHTTVVRCKYDKDSDDSFENKLCDECVQQRCHLESYGFETMEIRGPSNGR